MTVLFVPAVLLENVPVAPAVLNATLSPEITPTSVAPPVFNVAVFVPS